MDIRTELARIPDPRIDWCKKHNLVDILLLCIIAMVCGMKNVEDIVFFGETHEERLRKYLALPTVKLIDKQRVGSKVRKVYDKPMSWRFAGKDYRGRWIYPL
jgi:hypothetical protein